MSSPGVGKTVLLEQTLAALRDKFEIVVIEGDMTTELDAARLRKYDVPVIPINTGRYLDINLDLIADNVQQMNSNITIIYLLGKTGQSLSLWFDWVSDCFKERQANKLAMQI